MLFTGYENSQLNTEQLMCYNQFDLTIEGRFDKAKMGNFLWRGSYNQRISSPTKKYSSIIDSIYNSKSAGLHIEVIKNELMFYGIPTNNDEIYKLQKLISINPSVIDFSNEILK